MIEPRKQKILRYILVGPARSGTTVTHLALKGHPNVSAVRDEVRIDPLFTQGMGAFTTSGKTYLSEQEQENHISAIFDAITTLEADQNTIASGLKIAVSSPKLASQLVECLQTYMKDITIILTVREDIVAQYGSGLRSRATGQSHSWRKAKGNGDFTVNIAEDKFVSYANEILNVLEVLQKLKSTHQVIEINYEKNILPNMYEAYYKLFEALGLPQVEISWLNSSKVAPPPEEYILNYVNLRDILEQIKKGESEKLLNQFTKSKPVTSYQSNSNFTKLKSKVKKIISVIRE